jgi:ketosteroid isomerase-like protein
MSRGRIVAAPVAAALLLSGCGGGSAPAPQGPVIADAATAIAADEEQWNRDYAARDTERLIGHYAPGASMKAPNLPLLTGGWVRSSFESAMTDPAFSMTFRHDRIEVARSGDLAYSRGHYRMTWTDQQSRQPTTGYGDYLTIWQKQPDGRWKVLEDFTAPGPAPRPLM